MKTRTVISAITSIALAGVLCVSFAACSGNKDTAKDVKGDPIKKEVWDAAIQEDAFENFKLELDQLEVTERTQAENTIVIKKTTKAMYVYADQKTHVSGTEETKHTGVPEDQKDNYKDKSETKEYYLDESGSEEYGKCVSKVDGKWTNIELNSGNQFDYLSAKIASTVFIGVMLPSKDFEDYEYSETHMGYVLKATTDNSRLVVLKFKNGKLRAVCVEEFSEDTRGTGDDSYTLKRTVTESYLLTFGKQKVAIPVVK